MDFLYQNKIKKIQKFIQVCLLISNIYCLHIYIKGQLQALHVEIHCLIVKIISLDENMIISF